MASITQRFLVPVPTVSARNAWHNYPHFWPKNDKNAEGGRYFKKNWVGMCGTLLETLTVFQTKTVLSPNDEEAANSSKKHTQFKTRVHQPHPISDRNGRNWYPISDQDGWKKNRPFGAAHTHISYIRDSPPERGGMLSLAAYASETKKLDSIIVLGTCTVTLKHSK